MGRPPLPIGTHGTIRHEEIAPGQWRARCRFRDFDGITRDVERNGPTKGKAERALKEALRDRARSQGADDAFGSETRLSTVAELWLKEVKTTDLSDGTLETYERALRGRIIPGLGGLLVREVTVPACDRFVKAVHSDHGPSAARTCKNVLSLVMAMVVRHGVLDENPVRDVAKVSSGHKSRPRALTAEEQVEIRTRTRGDEQAHAQDVVDLIELLDGTGLRIGEALAIRASSVDLDAGVLEINATVIRPKGKGASLQERPKTEAGWRIIALPPNVIDLLRRRTARTFPGSSRPVIVKKEDGQETLSSVAELGVLFPGLKGGLRAPTNANRDMKAALDRISKAKYGWVTTHAFRKTVATRLDDAGESARKIADHLGHAKPSMTQDVYMGRGVATATAATVLGTGGQR